MSKTKTDIRYVKTKSGIRVLLKEGKPYRHILREEVGYTNDPKFLNSKNIEIRS